VKATYFLLVKSVASAAGAQSRATSVQDFELAARNAAARTGATIDNVWVAQGAYDFIVQVEVDTGQAPALGGPAGAEVTPQHAALALVTALSQNAAVTTETVPVLPAGDDTLQAFVGHSCT
jgi:hypothetical protein